MNLPNKLTMLRIILIPIMMGFLLIQFRGEYGYYAQFFALGIFILAAITDGLDGYIARRQGEITKFGKLIDPLADKLLISAALIAFVDMGRISAWPVLLIIGREFAVMGLRVLAAAEGTIISASKLGKAKTILQITAIISVMIHPQIISFPFQIHQILIWLAVGITIYSGYDYFRKGQKVLHEETTD